MHSLLYSSSERQTASFKPLKEHPFSDKSIYPSPLKTGKNDTLGDLRVALEMSSGGLAHRQGLVFYSPEPPSEEEDLMTGYGNHRPRSRGNTRHEGHSDSSSGTQHSCNNERGRYNNSPPPPQPPPHGDGLGQRGSIS